MRLERLQLSDFRSYQDADVDLSGVQLASVVGPNGAGKSSLLEAAVFALTGAKTMRDLNAFIRQGCEECRVALTFSTGGETYRLTRTRSNRNSGKSTLELARQDESGLWAAEGSGARDTDERVRAILGVDEDTLLQTAIVAQGDAGSFFVLRPAARLEALGSILKLDERFGPLEDRFKAQAAAAKTNLEQARRDVERLEFDVIRLEQKRDELAEAGRSVERAEQSLESDEEAVAEARAALGMARDAAAGYELAIAKRDELLKRRDALEGRTGDLNDEAENLYHRITSREDLETELARRGDLEAARELELKHQEQDQATLAERRRLTDCVTTAEADLAQAQADWAGAEKRKKIALSTAEAAQMKRQRATMDAQTIEARIREMETAARPVCDRCGQDVQDAALARAMDGLKTELVAAMERVVQAAADAEHYAELAEAAGEDMAAIVKRGGEAHELLEARKAELAALPATTYDAVQLAWVESELRSIAEIPAKLATIATLEERLAVVTAELDSLAMALADPEAADALARAEQAVSAAQGARARAEAAEGRLRDAGDALSGSRRLLSEAEKAAARIEGEVASLAPCRDQLAEAQTAAKTYEEEQADAELLRKAMGKWGVPALIVGNVLLSLEVEVNELLSLYEGSLALRFEGEKETGNGARDSLEIIVFDGADWRPFETFSGGERYRVASAMRLGLARLLAHRSGARVETLIVDEPEGLDAPGRAHLAAILARMAEDFGIVLLLTHYEDLKDAMPQQIVVSRGEDGLSRVEVSA